METLTVARIQPPVRSSSLNSTTGNSRHAQSPRSSPISAKPSLGSISPTSEGKSPASRSTDNIVQSPLNLNAPNPEEDVTNTLLEWKRSSFFRVSWVNPKELWNNDNEIFGQLNEVLDAPRQEQEIRDAVDALWEGNETFLPKVSMASYLGQPDPFHRRVLQHYVDRFDFADMRLDEAFRKLCSKVYFKAEAQQIDRILEVFAHRYHDCNANAIYGSAVVVHAVVYSLMLLNTDLHVVHGGHTRMNRTAFCRNTMRTVLDHIGSSKDAIERCGGLFYWQEEMDECLKELYYSVKQKGIVQSLNQEEKPKPTLLRRMGSLKQRSTTNESVAKHSAASSGDDSSMENHREKKDGPTIEKRLMCKRLSSSMKEWEECLVTLDQGSLHFKSPYKHTTVSLAYSITRIYHEEDHHPNTIVIQSMNNTKFIIDCVSENDAKNWISQCNYWAALQSKIVRHGVSNTKCYGWEPHLLESQDIDHIDKWIVPLTTTNLVSVGKEAYQTLETIEQYLDILKRDLDHHLHMQKAIQSLASKHPRIGSNWESKKQYLELEVDKYRCYRDAMREQEQRCLCPQLLDKRPLSSGIDLLREINDELEIAGGFLVT
ncbi:hypothetical protein EC973_007112 [Apophysomyces ossiformis]|uniref:SEC7 domain-containing protein n=1 Tax=Apophysomyces ossiformis TaxID=679940 RepID=A0A8H7BZ24_9FUNG|nr:hypothetical protein EC973_007112 [Apophysomyces ossiformis]